MNVLREEKYLVYRLHIPMRLLLSCSLSALAFLVTSFQSTAQSSVPAPSADKYAGEAFVIERGDSVYSFNADGTGYRQRTVVVKIQSEAALQELGVLTVPFAGASEHVEFHYARVRRPDGTVTETPVSGAIEQQAEVTREAPFYSDLKAEQLPVKDLHVGDTLEWEARVVRTKAEAPNEFWGNDSFVTEGAVVREESIELHVPATKAVTVWTNPALGITPQESTSGSEHVYRWQYAALKPTVGPEAEAEKAAQKKHMLTPAEELDSERGKLPSLAWTTFSNWATVGDWYRGQLGDRSVPDADVKAKVAELTAGKTTEEDKVRAVYEYVSTQIRYIGVDFGVGRYQPHTASDVLNNQYGDCKDKAVLLSAMLTALGEPSDAALIGAGVRFNPAVPSPGAFNHVITHLKLGGQDVWLDSTEEIAPYRMMYAGLRDKEALIVPPSGAATLARTPAAAPFPAFQTWTAKGSLDANGTSDSHITVTERGDIELILRAAVRQIGAAQYEEFAQRIVSGMGYAGTSSHAEFGRPDDVDKPFTIAFDYHREKNGDWDNLKIVAQLAPVSLPTVDEKDPPVATIDLGQPRTETSTAEMKLPAGWTAELPEAVHEKAAFATYDLTYRFDKGTLYSERRLVVLQQKIPATEWKAYKKWTDAIDLGDEPYVQLRRAGGSFLPPPPSASADGSKVISVDPDAKPQELLEQAAVALRAMDLAKAGALLDRVKALNHKQRGLWAACGMVALDFGKANEAIDDFRKELALYPDTYEMYGMIASVQQLHHDKAGAEETLRTWALADGNNPAPLLQLASLEYQDGNYAEAADAAQKALAMGDKDHPDEKTELLLGEAQMKLKVNDKATATLTALLKTTDDPNIMNDAAYDLADAGQQLPLDEEKEQIALQKLSAETQSWTLDEAPPTLKQKTALLLASWDTMGWILYREGKFEQAESYLEAAKLGRTDSVIREHLAKERAARAAATGKTVADPDAGKSEQQLRTIPLGPANGLHGFAEYRLLLSQGRVERAEPVGDEKLPGGENLLKAASFTRFFPTGSDAKLARLGVVNCVAGKCELVLEP